MKWYEVDHDPKCNIEVLGAEPLIPTGGCTCGALNVCYVSSKDADENGKCTKCGGLGIK